MTLGSFVKDLQRLFPTDRNMAVIIDDRADVWKNDLSNLVKVIPCKLRDLQGACSRPVADPQTTFSGSATLTPRFCHHAQTSPSRHRRLRRLQHLHLRPRARPRRQTPMLRQRMRI